MKIYRHADSVGLDGRSPVVVCGRFDGVHRGHLEVLRRAVAQARAVNGVSVAVTWQAPTIVARLSQPSPLRLGTLRQRVEWLAAAGVDISLLLPAAPDPEPIAAETFVRDCLIGRIHARRIVVGSVIESGQGSHLGLATMRRLGTEWHFEVDEVAAVLAEGSVVTGDAIRAALAAGDLAAANRMLGRNYSVCGRVKHGHHRGRALGFPTANLALDRVQLPPDGVYAVRARVAAGRFGGLANIGFNPTFAGAERSVEAHLFDFNGDLYGARVEISFVSRLRGEQKFPGPEALAAQIRADATAACAILESE